MNSENKKSNTVLIVVAIIGICGTITASIIGVIGNFNTEKFRQEAELTRIALISIATQGGATQVSMASSLSAPTDTPYPTNTLQPTYTPYPTYTLEPFPTIPPTASVNLPFADNFDNGASPFWKTTTSKGVWRTINGKYTVTGETNFDWAYSLIGDPNWQDYVVEVDYSLENDIYAGAAVIIRAGGPNNLTLAFAITNPGLASWRTWQDGRWQKLVTSENYPNTQGRIIIEVKGSTFTASASGIGQLTITDASASSGLVGLGVTCRYEDRCPQFDNFSVVNITP